MLFIKWRARRARKRLAGLRAQSTTLEQIYNNIDGEVPGMIVVKLMELSRQIGETQAHLEELEATKALADSERSTDSGGPCSKRPTPPPRNVTGGP